MTSAIFAPLIQSLIAAIGMVFTALVGIFVPRGIAAFERRTGVIVTDQERASVMSAVTTATGIIQTKLDQGLLGIAEVKQSNKLIQQEAAAALDRVPTSAMNQGVTPATVAAMIVGRLDTSVKAAAVSVADAGNVRLGAYAPTLPVADDGTVRLGGYAPTLPITGPA